MLLLQNEPEETVATVAAPPSKGQKGPSKQPKSKLDKRSNQVCVITSIFSFLNLLLIFAFFCYDRMRLKEPLRNGMARDKQEMFPIHLRNHQQQQ